MKSKETSRKFLFRISKQISLIGTRMYEYYPKKRGKKRPMLQTSNFSEGNDISNYYTEKDFGAL